MKTVLLTGANGFIGKKLSAKLLLQGYKVVGLSRTASSECIACDLEDADLLSETIQAANPDAVIHSAAISSVTRGSPVDYYNCNVIATENLIDAVNMLHGPRRIIYISTAAVYGNQDLSCLHEDLCPSPESHYGLSKYVAERLLKTRCSTHCLTILRPFNIIGDGQADDFIVPKLVSHFAQNAAKIDLGNIETKRDYLSVDKCCSYIAMALYNSQTFNETINLCSGMGVSLKQLIAMLENISKHKMEIHSVESLRRKNEIWELVGSVDKLNSIFPAMSVNEDIEQLLSDMLAKHVKN